MKKVYVLFFLVFLGFGNLSAQVNMTVTGSYTQDFNSFPTSGSIIWTDNSTIANWYAQRTGTGSSLAADIGSSNGGNLYNYGSAAASDRALGSIGSSNVAAGSFAWGLLLRNNSASVITDIKITYTGEQWRNSAAVAAQTAAFYYKISSSTIAALNPNSNATWTAVSALDFISPITAGTAGALDGNAGANRTTLTNIAIPTLTLSPGDYIMIKWDDPDHIGSDHGLSIDDLTVNWTVSAGGTPDIVLSSDNPAVPAGNITQGSLNNLIYDFDLAVTTADAVLNGVTVTTAGTYLASGITNLKCWYSTDNVFSPGTDVLLSTNSALTIAGPQVFPTFNAQAILNGATGYIFISADVSCAATVGNDISVNAITTGDISFVSGNKTGTASAGGLQTFTAVTPNNVTAPAASVGNTNSNLTWTNPAGCYIEIMIIASPGAPNSGGAPSGDGSAYAWDLNYGGGTNYGNGFVVYKGLTSGQLVTGLTNGTLYYYKFFTRFGTSWSSGIEISQTPGVVSSPTDYFRSVASGSWATLATWESSADSISWMASTLVPGAAAAHVVIQSPDSVWLTTNRTTLNLTILTGAVMNAGANTMLATDRFNLLGTASFYQGGIVKSVPGVVQILDVTSNYYFNGTQDGTANLTYPEFGNLFWQPNASQNGTFQNSIVAAPFNNGLVIRGDMTINIQGATPREIRFATGTSVSRSHIIDGNLNIISANSIVAINVGTIAVFSSVTIGGNINISAGALRGVGSSGNGILNLSGNINNTGGTVETGGGTGFFSINYLGTTAQSINNTGGTFNFFANQVDTLNNTGPGLTLNTLLIHGGTIQFISGLLTTTASNLLIMDAGSSVLGASNASFVNGPISKIGNTDFVFPVGKTNCGPSGTVNGYAPLQISGSAGGASTDRYTAEYIRNNTNFAAPKVLGLNRVSKCDYWNLIQDNGSSTLNVTLNWTDAINNCTFASPYVTQANLAALVVAHYDGTTWDSYGPPSTYTGTQASGDVTWPNVSAFSPFAIGSLSFLNPLPITINYFTGAKNNGNHLLNWKVTCISTPSATLELERSTDGRNFSSLYSIFATALRCADPFDYTDIQPAKGVNYYRIKMTSADGHVTYSTVVTLINAVKGIDILNIAPNPIVNGRFNLKVSSADKTQMELLITDMQGRILQKQTASLIAGFNSLPINVGNLAAGTYQLFGNTTDGRTRVLRFVVQ